ncbi:hypothetical protein GH714_036433 [Hevea brasiliensis]|uniref:Protein kinase domain-containing protein n=1 Tax=Hevea brasiliensis TaxID=3981 RepID=A0A6A6NER7_HEVBR|nr:hypothetical protein GH714_036433 [Hevea brasiliensis]
MKAAAEVLGNGGLGSSYKALLANGVAVVVKRLREMNALGRDGFDAEMRMLGRLKHANILPPLAFHFRKDEKLLIYEYIPKGSLLYLLHDFGYNTLANPSVVGQALIAYKAPEATQFGVSPKCDVYCLGLIILEILTGKYPSQYLNNGKGGIDLVQWAETKISEGKEYDMLDPEIASSSNSVGEMRQLIHIGALCAASNPVQRLDLREAIQRIEMKNWRV